MARPASAGPLGLRLALAFVGVALAAVAVLAGLTAAVRGRGRLPPGQTAATAPHPRGRGGRGRRVEPQGQLDRCGSVAGPDLAARVGADVQVRDTGGRWSGLAGIRRAAQRRTSAGDASSAGDGSPGRSSCDSAAAASAAPTNRSGQTCGARSPERPAGGAAGPAGSAGAVAADHPPVARLIQVARAMGGGDRSARVGEVRGPASCGTWPGLRPDGRIAGAPGKGAAQPGRGRRARAAHAGGRAAGRHEALLDGVTEPTPEQLGSLRDEVLRLARMVDDLAAGRRGGGRAAADARSV